MFCKYCGKQIMDGSVFCAFCGKTLGNSTTANEPTKVNEVELAGPEELRMQQSKPATAAPEAPAPASAFRTEQPGVNVPPMANPYSNPAPQPAEPATLAVNAMPPVPADVIQPTASGAQIQLAVAPAAPAKKSKKWIIALICIIVAVLLILGGGFGAVYYFFLSPDAKNKKQTKEETSVQESEITSEEISEIENPSELPSEEPSVEEPGDKKPPVPGGTEKPDDKDLPEPGGEEGPLIPDAKPIDELP